MEKGKEHRAFWAIKEAIKRKTELKHLKSKNWNGLRSQEGRAGSNAAAEGGREFEQKHLINELAILAVV